MLTSRRRSHRLRHAAVVVSMSAIAASLVAGCSDGDDDSGPAATAPATDAPAPTSSASSSTTPAAAALEWHRLQLGIANTYVLVRGDDVAIVDPGLADTAALTAELDKLGLAIEDVDHVVTTHQHPDHSASVDAVLTAAPDATGYAGESDAPAVTASRPLTGVGDGDTVLRLDVIATPGHTPGSICLYDRDSSVLLAGDAFNTDGSAVIGPRPEFTADVAQAEDSLRKLAALDFETVLFGHGDPIESGAGQSLDQYVATL